MKALIGRFVVFVILLCLTQPSLKAADTTVVSKEAQAYADFIKGVYLQNFGEFDLSYSYLEPLLKEYRIPPKEVLIHLGNIQLIKGNIEEAKRLFRKLFNAYYDPTGIVLLFYSYMQEKNPEGLWDAYKAFLEDLVNIENPSPDLIDLARSMGILLNFQNIYFAGADKLADMFLSQGNNPPEMFVIIAWFLVMNGDIDKAIDCVELALQKGIDSEYFSKDFVYSYLGILYGLQGKDYKKAEENLLKAVSFSKEDGKASYLEMLAWVRIKMLDYDGADEALKDIPNRSEMPLASYCYALVLEHKGLLQESLDWANRTLRLMEKQEKDGSIAYYYKQQYDDIMNGTLELKKRLLYKMGK